LKVLSRRDFIKAAGAGILAAGLGPGITAPLGARAAGKKLKILQWGHFVSTFDTWFDDIFVKQWGEKNDTEVIVDHVSYLQLKYRAVAEIKAQKGHDLFMFVDPPSAFENQVIDHGDIYRECEKRYGEIIPLAVKSTYNPRTEKSYGFCCSYSPDPINYRRDLWDGVGMFPDSWEDIRIGGAKIRKKYGKPVGIGLSRDIDSNMAMRAVLYSHGASVQDEEGNVVINSKETLEAVKFVRALFLEAMTPDVLNWDSASNNIFMLNGNGSLVLNAISINRSAEEKAQYAGISKDIWLARAAAGPVRRLGLEHIVTVYVIWKFADNIEGAKHFLVDYTGDFKEAFLAGGFYDFPSFPATVPDLENLIASDPKAEPPDKYRVLADVKDWTTNIGYPGYANAAVDVIFGTGVITTMFKKAATGESSPRDAVREAEEKCKTIFAAWRQKGMV
jgi:multiple sugar transport system substrate-binding protein